MWTSDPADRFGVQAEELLPGAFVLKWSDRLKRPDEPTPGRPSSIWGQMVHAAHLREIYQRTNDLARVNDVVGKSTFFSYLIETYASTQAIMVRRQADPSPRVTTLGRFLFEVSEALANELKAGRPASADRLLRDRTAEAIGAAKTDQDSLENAVAPVRAFVDKRLAHMDAGSVKPERARLEVQAIHNALDVTFAVFQRWETWLIGASTPNLVPIIQGEDWEAVFRVPWIDAERD